MSVSVTLTLTPNAGYKRGFLKYNIVDDATNAILIGQINGIRKAGFGSVSTKHLSVNGAPVPHAGAGWRLTVHMATAGGLTAKIAIEHASPDTDVGLLAAQMVTNCTMLDGTAFTHMISATFDARLYV